MPRLSWLSLSQSASSHCARRRVKWMRPGLSSSFFHSLCRVFCLCPSVLLLLLVTTASLSLASFDSVLSASRIQYGSFRTSCQRLAEMLRCSQWSSQMEMARSSKSLSLAQSSRGPTNQAESCSMGCPTSSSFHARSRRRRCPGPEAAASPKEIDAARQSQTHVWVKFLDTRVKVSLHSDFFTIKESLLDEESPELRSRASFLQGCYSSETANTDVSTWWRNKCFTERGRFGY